MPNPRHLQRHHNTWVLHIRVPQDLVSVEGRRYIRKSLQTGDIRTAKVRRDIELGRIRERWARLREGASDDPSSLRWLRDGAASIQADLRDGTLTVSEANDLIGELVERHLQQYRTKPDSSGTYPEDEYEITEEHAAEIRDAIASVSRPDQVSLRNAVSTYLEEIKPRIRTKSWNQKRRYLDLLLGFHRPTRPISTLDRAAARRFMQQVVHKLPVTVATRRVAFSVYNAFGQWCDDSGLIENPFHGMGRTIRAPVRAVRRDDMRRPWTADELVKFFTFEGVHPRYWKVWYGCALLLLTGARRAEIINARTDALVNNGTGLEVTEAKNEDSLRVIPLHPLAQPLVKTLVERSDDGYLLPGYPMGGQDKDDRGNAFYKQFQRVRLLTTGIGPNMGLDLHSFRHTFETVAANHGMDQRIINEITGHSNDDGTGQRVYLHGIEFDRCYKALKRLSFGPQVTKLLKNPPTSLRAIS